MKWNKIRKSVALFGAAVMATGILAGCGGSGQTASSTEQSASTEQAAGGEESQQDASGGERETLTVGVVKSSYVEDYDTNYLTQMIEEGCNVDLEFVYLPGTVEDAKSKFAVMASSGTTLPDVVIQENFFSGTELLDYGSKGIFIPLNDYLSDESKAVYFSQIPEEDREKMLQASTSPDGNIYALTKFAPEEWNLTPNRFWINRTWLDTLGLEEPTTTEELQEVLRAFVTEDPNGNGVADEIGITGCLDGWGCNAVMYLLNSFVFYNGGLALDETGTTVIAPFVTDEWKQALEYMNQLCSEGLLSPTIFTQDASQYTATLSNEPEIVGGGAAGGDGYWSGGNQSENFKDMEMLPPVEGPNGVAYAYYFDYTPASAFVITKDCKNPELAFKVGDFFYRQDVSLTSRYGEENVDWSSDPEICSQYEGMYEAMDGIPCTMAQLTDLWPIPAQNKHWKDIGPSYRSLDMYHGISAGLKSEDGESNIAAVMRQESRANYYDKHPEYVLPALQYTQEESDRIAEPQENVNSYVNQSLAEFVTGNRSLNDWDAYVEELNNMGLQEWIETAQTAYDRMQNQ